MMEKGHNGLVLAQENEMFDSYFKLTHNVKLCIGSWNINAKK